MGIVCDKDGLMFNIPEAVVFDLDHYTSAISNRNARILEFTTKEEFKDASMLEVGAGIGLPGSTFSDLGCTITSVDGRADNVKEGISRFPDREWILKNPVLKIVLRGGSLTTSFVWDCYTI